MQGHEYKVVPAPRRGLKARGLKRPEDRFAHAIQTEMNRMAAEGWEFVRSDTLPCEHRQGWFSRSTTVFETLLVFRRPQAQADRHASPAMPPPVTVTPSAPLPEEPRVAAPAALRPAEEARLAAASRFTPAPHVLLPANDAPPVAAPAAPTLTVVESDPANPRHAAE